MGTSTVRYDVVAIGGGNAGLTAAARVAAAGRKTALIDRGPVGGLCSLNGCNPKKVLWRSSAALDEIHRAGSFGITVGPPRVDWSAVIDRKETFTRPVTAATEQTLATEGVDLVRGTPRFVEPGLLEVAGRHIETGAVVVATGSVPRPLEFPGAELTRTSDDILAERRVPARLVIIGAGVVAFEFGQIFARLGTRVTIVTPGKRVLGGLDEELVDALVAFSTGLSITVGTETTVRSVGRDGDAFRVEIEHDGRVQALAADFVLNAAGRVPSIGDLALERAGAQATAHGITVTDFLRSPTNPHLFAAGDAHGRRQLSPVASHEGRIAARNLLEGDVERVDYASIPAVVFTIPPLAAVGMTEAEARRAGREPTVVKSDMTSWKVFAIPGEPVARAKVILDKPGGRILGAHLFAGEAAETINLFATAIRFGIDAAQLRGMVFTYPTASSALPHMLG